MNEIIIRTDGRNFSKYTDRWFNRPFDTRFAKCMIAATYNVMKNEGFPIVRAYTQSDEASFLLQSETNLYARRQEKLASIFSGLMTKQFIIALNEFNKEDSACEASFDGKVFYLPEEEVESYFISRLNNSINNYQMQWSNHVMKSQGLSGKTRSRTIEEKGAACRMPFDLEIIDLVAYGTEFRKIEYYKEAENKLTGDDVVVPRNIIVASTPVLFDQIKNDNRVNTKRYN